LRFAVFDFAAGLAAFGFAFACFLRAAGLRRLSSHASNSAAGSGGQMR
jgi:hypothetical protein